MIFQSHRRRMSGVGRPRLSPPACRRWSEGFVPASYTRRRTHFRSAYLAILEAGDALNPRAPPSGKRGRTKQSKARNLLDRLRDQAAVVWGFMDDHEVNAV